MSHVTQVECQILDLDCLEAAIAPLGLELMRGQSTYRWYGTFVGDAPLPEGVKVEDLGRCAHAIRVKPHAGLSSKPYEIGLVKQENGSYRLAWDFWRGGYGLEDCAGTGCQKVVQGYAVEVSKKHLRKAGYQPVCTTLANGEVQIKARR